MLPKIIIYTTPTCPFCQMLKVYFADNNIEYEEKNVAGDEVAQKEMLDKSGALEVPVIDIDGIILKGFDKKKLDEVLGIKS